MARRCALLISILLVPAVTWAGTGIGTVTRTLPVLTDAGLITLGISLVGVGFALLRSNKR